MSNLIGLLDIIHPILSIQEEIREILGGATAIVVSPIITYIWRPSLVDPLN